MVFSGTVNSDYLKLVSVTEANKENLINYAATDFYTLKDSLINYIKAVYPLDYQNFIEADLGMMLVELVAYMGAVLSFKADLLANENFLRTCKSRNNVKKLLELIGVRMKGPISAAANAQLTLNTAPAWTDPVNDELLITPTNRVVSVVSPEDGGPLNFTLYKVLSSGLVDLANGTGNIVLKNSESDNAPTGTVFSNLVLLEGALVTEAGYFTEADGVKTISLNASPVVEKSVQVYVTGGANTTGAYKEVDNIFSASAVDDKVFQVSYNDDFAAVVMFGDNTLGVSPLAGDAYLVTYRVGGGTRGNVPREFINTSITTSYEGVTDIAGVIENISIGTGGANAESVDHAKKYAPLTFKRQDRLVTLDDFKTFANSFATSYGSTGKATAVVRRAYSSANVIDMYVLEKASALQLRKATPVYKEQLLNAINDKKMLTDEIVIVDGLIRTLDLILSVRVDKYLAAKEEDIKLQVKNKIVEFFNVDNRDFGEAFVCGDLTRYLFDISDIRYATVDNLFSDVIKVDFNEIVQLNNFTINIIPI